MCKHGCTHTTYTRTWHTNIYMQIYTNTIYTFTSHPYTQINTHGHTHKCTWVYTHIHTIYTHAYRHIYMNTHTHMHPDIHRYTYTSGVHAYTHKHTHRHTQMHTYHTHIPTWYTHTHTHTHTYIHAHTYTLFMVNCGPQLIPESMAEYFDHLHTDLKVGL